MDMSDGANRRPPAAGDLLTVAEVAAMLRVSKMTIYRLIDAGRLNAVRVGRSFRLPQASVESFLREASDPDRCG